VLRAYRQGVLLRPFLYEPTSCASYLFGCLTVDRLAVVDPHAELVDAYLDAARRAGAPITAVFETHVQADHVSGLPELVAAGATAYLPAGAAVAFDHVALDDGAVVELGNTVVRALATPGHAPAHHAYVVADRRRGSERPWLAFTGDSLLVGDVGRPDLHTDDDGSASARTLHASLRKLLELPDDVLVYPSHYAGSVCGRKLSANPFSTIGFEREHNHALAYADPDAFAAALLVDVPPPPAGQGAIVAANRAGRPRAAA
jgi:glyoxylase-like metal-dependent hydrolase (beta-lactamase superfamily II)